MKHNWTERKIAAALSRAKFLASSILVVPNCSWCGDEADLLVIERNLRIIDVEIKISRADFLADAKKDKWWRRRPWSRRAATPVARIWPDKVWKHYYVVPAAVFSPDMADAVSPASGIILVGKQDARYASGALLTPYRKATPNRDAKPISPADAIDIARLASLRMWSVISRDLGI